MSETSPENDHLREALSALPVPKADPDFDDRVLSALIKRRSWWEDLWIASRPVVTGAGCSLCLTVCAALWATHVPPVSVTSTPVPYVATQLTASEIDRLLDEPRLTPGSLTAFALMQATTPVLPPEAADKPSRPVRRVCSFCGTITA